VAQLSEWLQIMLAEIARKQEEALRSAEEEQRRRATPADAPATSATSASALASASASERLAAP
jgi:hypothetical protein